MGGHQEENDQWPAVALKSGNMSVKLTVLAIKETILGSERRERDKRSWMTV